MTETAKTSESRSSLDDIIDVYKRDIDRTLVRENLKLSVEARMLKFIDFMKLLSEVRRAGEETRRKRA